MLFGIALRLTVIPALTATTVYFLVVSVFDRYEHIAPRRRELATLVVHAGIVAMSIAALCAILTRMQPWRLIAALGCCIVLAYAMPTAFRLMQPGDANELLPPLVGWQLLSPTMFLAGGVGATVVLLVALPPAVRPVALIGGSLAIIGYGVAAYDGLVMWFKDQPWVAEVAACYTAINLVAYVLPSWLALVMGVLSSPALLNGHTPGRHQVRRNAHGRLCRIMPPR
jgi:hypothetical protein